MYNFVDHTADIAFEIYAKDLNELLRDAALAFYEAFVFTEKIGDHIQREIEIEESSVDYLLYNWLNEILYLFDVEHFGGKKVDVKVMSGRAKGKIYGDVLDPQKIKLEPKAITLHNFRVEKRNGGYYAYIVIDI
uniref:Archease n=1 Tax=Geoglobus ahangari TaxID=113653 RepID=A0A7C3YEY3_9EURY